MSMTNCLWELFFSYILIAEVETPLHGEERLKGSCENMDLLRSTEWTFPIPIIYGPGRVAEVVQVCRRNGIRRPLLVTDQGSRALPFIDEMLRSLQDGGLEAKIFAGVSPNPTDAEVVAGKRAFEVGGHDGIIAVGGGSGMDAGKAVSLLAGRKNPLWEFDFDLEPRTDIGTFAPLICIPTTAGTGAESESTAMITDTARGIKGCVWHPDQKPLAALLDPELTLGLPRDLTIWTGCDALAHAIESYCVDAWHPLCDGVALEALRLLTAHFTIAVDRPEDIRGRGGMLVASCLAGVSFLKGLGMVHAISHMVGAHFDTHHGLTNAVMLPLVLRFNEHSIADKVPALCSALGFERETFEGLHDGVCGMLDEFGIPKSLSELDVSADAATEIALKASRDPAAASNPRQASIEEIEALIHEAIAGAR